MNPTQELHALGQSLWLDNITRTMLDDGTLRHYIDDLSITGLTSNPTIFDKAIGGGDAYDEAIVETAPKVDSNEDIFFSLAIEDLGRTCDEFKGVHERTDGVDGFASLEVSPLLADDAQATIKQASDLHSRGGHENLFIKIPGTEAGRTAIEETIAAGTPVNVTLLFDAEQYLAAAEAYVRGIERRIADGLDPAVPSVASLFVSRWDVAVADEISDELRNKLGIAVAADGYRAYRELLDSERWQRLENEGARPQRFLFASTGTKDPDASDVLYVEALSAPHSINTMPDATLKAFADHGEAGDPLPADGGEPAASLPEFEAAGIDLAALATRLQREGAAAFDKSWNEMLGTIESKSKALTSA